MDAAYARAYAGRLGPRGTLALLEGDHFLLAKRAKEVRAVIREWLRAQSAR